MPAPFLKKKITVVSLSSLLGVPYRSPNMICDEVQSSLIFFFQLKKWKLRHLGAWRGARRRGSTMCNLSILTPQQFRSSRGGCGVRTLCTVAYGRRPRCHLVRACSSSTRRRPSRRISSSPGDPLSDEPEPNPTTPLPPLSFIPGYDPVCWSLFLFCLCSISIFVDNFMLYVTVL